MEIKDTYTRAELLALLANEESESLLKGLQGDEWAMGQAYEAHHLYLLFGGSYDDKEGA